MDVYNILAGSLISPEAGAKLGMVAEMLLALMNLGASSTEAGMALVAKYRASSAPVITKLYVSAVVWSLRMET